MKTGKIKISVMEVAGIYPAIYGMRNPFNSHDKSDSRKRFQGLDVIGKNDMVLAKKLIKAGPEHRKFLRQIQVWLDMHFPRYFWQEFDTYKFNTKNSKSTMHTLHKREFTIEDFYLGEEPKWRLLYHLEYNVIPTLNNWRGDYLEERDYDYIKYMKRILPESFIQKRTVNTNYEELLNIYHQRKNHRLKEEWGAFLETVKTLPYFKEMILDTLS